MAQYTLIQATTRIDCKLATTRSLDSPSLLRTVFFLVVIMLFFVFTLLVSFFLMILLINRENVPIADGPNFFMIGLIPPSVVTVVVYIKLLGKRLIPKTSPK